MKMIMFFAVISLSLLSTVPAQTNEAPDPAELNRMTMQAIGLKEKGRFIEAEAMLKRLAQFEPDDAGVKLMLAEVAPKARAQREDPVAVLKRQLDKTVVPEINFREANPLDVIEYLRDESKKYTPDKSDINYVWLVPPDAKVGVVTLSLRSVSLTDVLHYVTQMAGLRYRLDPHAVVIYQSEAEPTPAPNVKSE
jgi:hypothetical protein